MIHVIRSKAAMAAGALAFLLVAAACSSTAQQSNPGQSPGLGGDDFSAELPPGAHVNKKGQVVSKSGKVLGTAEEFGVSESGAGGGGAASGGGGGTGGSGGAAAGGGSGGGSAAAAPSGGTIKIGAVVPAGDAGKAFGVSASYGDDAKRYVNAMVKEINAHGGIAGRKVEAVVAEQDQTDQSQEDETREGNEICTRMTEDEKVFMVMNFVLWGRYSFECYARHQTPIWPSTPNIDEAGMQKLQPWLLPSTWMTYSRMAKLIPLALQKESALTKKMGLIGFDLPDLKRAAERELIPGIKKRGGVLLDSAFVPPSYGEGVAGISSAVLRFKQQGINRVVFFAPGGAAWLVFAREAESQDYRPGYGVSSYDNPPFIETLLPQRQLEGTVGAGFNAGFDVTEKAQPPLRAREKQCWAILKKRAGVNYKSRTTRPNVFPYCDAFWLLQEALKPATGRQFDRADLSSLYFSVGSGFNSASLADSLFASRRTDGVSVYAPFRYMPNGCSCFKYQSGYRKIPF